MSMRILSGIIAPVVIVAWYWLFVWLASLATQVVVVTGLVLALYAGTSVLVLVELVIAVLTFRAGQLGKYALAAISVASLLVLPETVLQTFAPNSDPIGFILASWLGQILFVVIALAVTLHMLIKRR